MNRLLVALAAALLMVPAVRADSEFSVVLQGGASKYTQALSSGSDVGAAYGARFGILPTPMLGIEIGYLGTQNNISESLSQGRFARGTASGGSGQKSADRSFRHAAKRSGGRTATANQTATANPTATSTATTTATSTAISRPGD